MRYASRNLISVLEIDSKIVIEWFSNNYVCPTDRNECPCKDCKSGSLQRNKSKEDDGNDVESDDETGADKGADVEEVELSNVLLGERQRF